jgi:hypothetical protein
MAVSHQHLRESQALHSDYYSKKKKTASALRKRITTRRGVRHRRHHVLIFDHRASFAPHAAPLPRAGSSRNCENHCEIGISCMHESLCAAASASP